MIKNFRLVNLKDEEAKYAKKETKPITAAPLPYSNSRANIIKNLTGHSNRKGKHTPMPSFNQLKTPKKLPVSNSLLNQNEVTFDNKMEPINEFFEQLYEETHYMFPKDKSKFGVKPSLNSTYNSGFPRRKGHDRSKNMSVAIDPASTTKLIPEPKNIDTSFTKFEDDEITKGLRDKASRFNTPKYRSKVMLQEQGIRDKIELDKLLQNSLTKRAKETKEKSYEQMLSKTITGKFNEAGGGLSEEDKLNMIMSTWLYSNHADAEYTYEQLQSEAKITFNNILKTHSHDALYPKELKDCEVDIYMHNRKNAPKYEMLQYVKFSNSEEQDDSSKTGTAGTTKGETAEKDSNQEPYDLKLGIINPINNARLFLSFKLKVEFLDHIIPDFETPEHLPHSIFDD